MNRKQCISGTEIASMVNNDAISGNYVMPQWPGYEQDCAAREPLRLYCDYASVARQQWKNVAIVSANNMAVHGIINLFKTLYPLCLQIFSDAKGLQYSLMVTKNFHPDIIIWIDARVQRLEGMSSLAIQISRRMPGVKQLMLSECIPSELTVRLRGVRVASLNTPISELTKIMKACLVPVERTGGLFSGRFMTPGQWRTIRLLIKGLSVRQVAELNGISPKTVWGREEEVMRQLNLQGHVQKAWFYRSITEVLEDMPGLGRHKRGRRR
ncbi:helix-turn-helix transcriptional regulator [Pluralibacter gergoviae]|uniref:helix-turn-helix transcriptional regulator n=1 Tax=Pluralibacter gergoviae TaxID=61647 RepID=UPI000B6ADB62|nr:hypothetical protein [Pluralibacter gergoviae]EKT9638480.1 hypothetical protein [Pluralibacter gergoviae]EKV3542363.1 hypothetical protein [Pluralibacter gergoviae]EKV9901682.1 hypothetical protein [Pluralibacter gergoviae]EKV9933493.1 hypothetical protein [Pluralibacter gergoviae]EKW9977883.1 hypothetical protein [Pluralibacter gergoviae]